MECSVCGKSDWKTISQVGDIEIWACQSCGRKESVALARLAPAGVPVFKPVKAVGKWTKKPSISDIKQMKLIFPDVSASDATLLRHFFLGISIDLGVIPDFKIEAARKQAVEAGIHIDFLPLD